MMDELELLKRDWQKKNQSFKQINENEIAKMQHKSSSSSVKWIFYISLIEFMVFGVLGLFFISEKSLKDFETIHLKEFYFVFSIFNYLVLFYFLYKFYKNYTKINTTNTIKELLENILSSRKTLKYYVNYNLIGLAVMGVISSVFIINYHPQVLKLIEKNGESVRYILLGIYIAIFGFVTFIFWLFYKLLYGFLIKRLQRNYKELQKIEQ